MRAGPARLALATWWLAGAAAVALLPLAAAQDCTLTLPLNATASAVSMNGSAVDTTKPLAMRVTFVPAHPEAAVGFEGALALVLAGADPCPTAAADVLPLLVGAQVQTNSATGPLLLYPTGGIQLNGNPAVVNLTLQENFFAVSSTPLAAAAGGATGAFSADLTGLNTNGTVLSKSLAASAPEVLSITGMNDTNASAITATVQGSTLTLTLEVSWLMPSYYESQNAGITYAGTNQYAFNGQIVAQATLGCPGNCSAPNGRCATAADGTAGCTCSCGWTGPNCEIASGFCSTFPAELQGQPQICPAAPAPAPPSSGPCQAQVCTERQQYNSKTGRCDCQAGWGGPGCDACQSDAVCASFFGASGATCSAEVAFQQGMQFKAYTCDLTGSGLKGIIEPGTFYMVCNTSALPPGQALASSVDQSCQVHFTLAQAKDNPVTCTATECAFRANSSRVDCVSTHCECQTEGCAVQNILNDVEGKPCSIDCTADGTCSFNIQDFIFDLVAPCQTAACVVPGFTFVEGDYRITTSRSYDPAIAAIPVMVLVALAAFLSLYLVRHRALFASGQRAAAAAAAGTAGGAAVTSARRQRPSDPVHLLTFDGVSCAVPVRQGGSWRRWLRRGKGAAPQGQRAAAEAGATVDVTASHPPEKLILRNVSGAAACGELVGVLGPSGSGKTTLLAVLAGSTEDLDRRSSLAGSVRLDGQPLSASNRRRIAFVPQDDSMLPTLTVEECIRYSAILRLQGASPAEVQTAVQSVVAELGLQHVARSRVGGRSGIRGISGGERRRVTIAMELVTAPAVLVLDEPTSGLDSYTALNLMRTLKQVASGGRIVLLSFHQPSPAMFSLLDSAYLMAQGRCIFAGPPASAEGWLAGRGLPCPVGTAIAEHMLDSVSDPASLQQLLAAHDKEGSSGGAAAAEGPAGGGAANGAAGNGAANRHAPSAAASNGTMAFSSKADGSSCAKLDANASNDASNSDASAVAAAAEAGAAATGKGDVAEAAGAAVLPWRPSLSRELAVVFWRTLVDIVRNPALLLLHWVLALLMGAFVGAVFFDVSFDVSGAQNRVGGMFFVLCFFAFTSLTTVDLLMMERKMVLREVRGGYYRPASYLLAKMVLDALLLRVIPVFVFSAAFYPMMGLQSGAATVATFLMVVAAFAGAMGALSLSVTVGSSTAGLASLIMNILLLIAVVVSGMLVNPESMPAWIRWTHWLSPFFYAYSSLMINEMSGIKINFELKGYAAASNVRGTVFLETIGISADDLTRDIIVNDCYYLGLALLAFVLLYLVMPRPRWAGTAGRKP
ncbi:hypothetical protein ABPG75_013820 [Micractinium tetrahymenae]